VFFDSSTVEREALSRYQTVRRHTTEYHSIDICNLQLHLVIVKMGHSSLFCMLCGNFVCFYLNAWTEYFKA
jgi:hypothetical protein